MREDEKKEKQKQRERKRNEDKEESETVTVKRRCEGCFSVEAFDFFFFNQRVRFRELW